MVRRLVFATLAVALLLVPMIGASADARSRGAEADIELVSFSPAVDPVIQGDPPGDIPVVLAGQQASAEFVIRNAGPRPVKGEARIIEDFSGDVIASRSVTVGADTTETVQVAWQPGDHFSLGTFLLDGEIDFSADTTPGNNRDANAVYVGFEGQQVMWFSGFDVAVSSAGQNISTSVSVEAMTLTSSRSRRAREASANDVTVVIGATEIIDSTGELIGHSASGVTDASGEVTIEMELVNNCAESSVSVFSDRLEKDGYYPLYFLNTATTFESISPHDCPAQR